MKEEFDYCCSLYRGTTVLLGLAYPLVSHSGLADAIQR